MKRAATFAAVLTLGAGLVLAGCGASTDEKIQQVVNDPDAVARFCAESIDHGSSAEEVYGYMLMFPGLVTAMEAKEGMEPGTALRFMEELIANGGCPKIQIDDAPATYDPGVTP